MKRQLLKAGVRLLRAMPKEHAGAIISGVNRLRVQRVKRRKVPMSLIFFITNRCNAACSHCFYWKELSRKRDELSIEEIRKLSLTLPGLENVLLTGGEPFLRDEIVEISRLFRDIGVRSMTIPTNGILTDRITRSVAQMLESGDLNDLRINVSLDGTRDVHNAIRNVPGCFERACETIRQLKELMHTYAALHVSTTTVVSQTNMGNLKDFFHEARKLEVPLMVTLARGTDTNSFGIPPDKRMDFNPREEVSLEDGVDRDMVMETIERETQGGDAVNWNIFQQLKMDYTFDILKKRTYPLDCLAGHVDGVIHSNGGVSICELTRPVGNLKEANMDFQKIWWSTAANAMRRAAGNCCCIHGCNLLSNMQYDAKTLRRILLDSDYSL